MKTRICFSKNQVSGFTLLELIVVLTIISIAMAIVAPMVGNNIGSAKLRASTRHLAALMRYARSQAVATKLPQSVEINLSERSFWYQPNTVTETNSEDQQQDSGFFEKDQPSDSKTYYFPENIRLRFTQSSEEITDLETVAVKFYPHGNCNGGKVEIIREDQERGFIVEADAITGFVRIQDLHEKSG